MTGAAVDRRRKRIALGELSLATQEVDVTADDIEDGAIAILNDNILFASSVSLARVPSEAEAQAAAAPVIVNEVRRCVSCALRSRP